MRQIPVWATLFTILGLIVLIGLGVWQIQRLQWKTGLLAKIDAAYQDERTGAVNSSDLQRAFMRGDNFFRGTLTGQFLPQHSVRITPRPLDGAPGVHLYMPLLLQDGGHVLVNRGWVPDEETIIDTPAGTIEMTAAFRKPEKPSRFTPPNDPASAQWHSIDLAQIAADKGLNEFAPFIAWAETSPDATWPKALGGKPQLNNNHRAYALFWFAMAGALAAVYYFRFIAGQKAARP